MASSRDLEIELAGRGGGADSGARTDGGAFGRCVAIVADGLAGKRTENGRSADDRGVVLGVRLPFTRIPRCANADDAAVGKGDRSEREGKRRRPADSSRGFGIADVYSALLMCTTAGEPALATVLPPTTTGDVNTAGTDCPGLAVAVEIVLVILKRIGVPAGTTIVRAVAAPAEAMTNMRAVAIRKRVVMMACGITTRARRRARRLARTATIPWPALRPVCPGSGRGGSRGRQGLPCAGSSPGSRSRSRRGREDQVPVSSPRGVSAHDSMTSSKARSIE